MPDKKISELTELTSANAANDFLPAVDSSQTKTRKIKVANFPLSDSAERHAYPYTIEVSTGGVFTANNRTTIDK